MTPAMTIDPTTANGMSRFGFLLSPPICVACSKPVKAKMMPPLAMAIISALAMRTSPGKNPPPAVKLPAWNRVTMSVMTASRGTTTLTVVSALFARSTHRIPMRLMITKTASRPTATAIPGPVRWPPVALYSPPPPRGRRHVLDGGDDLDRRMCRGLQISEPPERGAGEAAERVLREQPSAAGHRQHPAELGVDQTEHDDDGRRDHPGDQRRRTGDGEGKQNSKEPSGPNDGPPRSPQHPQPADVSFQVVPRARVSRLLQRDGSLRSRCHV